MLYYHGQGAPQNYVKACKWYRRAAEQGYARAQAALGVLYYHGQGVPQNYIKAYKWFILGKASLSPTNLFFGPVSGIIRSLRAHMTPAEIARAQQEAASWVATHPHAGPSH